ncbi:hypothetical protein LINPERHAP1_LOCUS22626, partial [Linum perenne]
LRPVNSLPRRPLTDLAAVSGTTAVSGAAVSLVRCFLQFGGCLWLRPLPIAPLLFPLPSLLSRWNLTAPAGLHLLLAAMKPDYSLYP